MVYLCRIGRDLRQEARVDIIEDIAEIREIYGEPMERTIKKQLPRLEKHSRAFIALSPFLVMASTDPSGRCDASPKGDAPGFVQVLDDQTLLIPDRLGNNRIDTPEQQTRLKDQIADPLRRISTQLFPTYRARLVELRARAIEERSAALLELGRPGRELDAPRQAEQILLREMGGRGAWPSITRICSP
jgi:hypothetical protein